MTFGRMETVQPNENERTFAERAERRTKDLTTSGETRYERVDTGKPVASVPGGREACVKANG